MSKRQALSQLTKDGEDRGYDEDRERRRSDSPEEAAEASKEVLSRRK